MKKAFPVLWRYILVVTMSCALAFFISQNTAKATESIVMKVANPSIGAVFEQFMPQAPRLMWLYESERLDAAQKLKGEE